MSCLSWMRGKRVLNRFFLSELSIHKAFSHHSTKLQHVLLSSFIGARIYHLLHQHKCRNINTGSKPNIFHLVLVFTLILLNLIQDPVFFFFFGNLSKRHCLSLLLYNWISFKLSFVLSFSVTFMQCWAFLFLVQYTQSCGFSACQSGERMSGQFAYQIYWRRRGLCACQIYWRRRGLSACLSVKVTSPMCPSLYMKEVWPLCVLIKGGMVYNPQTVYKRRRGLCQSK